MWDMSSFCFFSCVFLERKYIPFSLTCAFSWVGDNCSCVILLVLPILLSDLEMGLSSRSCAFKGWCAHRGEADKKTIQRAESKNWTCYFRRQRQWLPSVNHSIEWLYTPSVNIPVSWLLSLLVAGIIHPIW